MPSPRAPWWMYVVAASFVAFFGFTIYADFVAPEPAGIDVYDFARGNLHLTQIAVGSAMERAGVHAGDRIVAVDGDVIHEFADWEHSRLFFRRGQPVDLEVERDGTHLHRPLTLAARLSLASGSSRGYIRPGNVAYFAWRAAMLSFLVISFFVFLRPDDLSARLGSLMLASFVAGLPILGHGYGWGAAWRDLPLPLAFLLAIPALSVAVAPAAALSLFSVFPRDYFSSRRRLLAWCVPPLLLAPLVFHWFWPLYDPPAILRAWQGRPVAAYNVTLGAYTAAAYLVLALNYRRLKDQNERRRVRAIIPPTVIFWTIALHVIVVQNWTSWMGTTPPAFFSQSAFAIDGVLIQIFPLSLAYVILKHRVFNVTVVIRRGLQYALARRVVVSMLPAVGVLLLFDIALHRDQTIGAVLSQRGWLYAVVGAAALVARQKQQQWLDALDRRFFRERYNAEHLLRETAEEIRQSASLEHVSSRVVGRIESSLHPEFAALLVRGPEETAYRTLASAPAGFSPPLMRADSKLVGLLRLLGKPLQISASDSGWLAQLPHADTEFLRRARIDLLVPVSLSTFSREALLVLGPKKSEEPYGREDQELLVAIANGLALLLERPATAASSSGLEECPRCGACYDSGVVLCREDGATLAPSAVPRVLAGRYRLDRRLGRGGMGTVYSALDTSLERHVALKLIRDELVSSTDAAERFRREAKAAAAIAHPNLVTLYDFAVDPGHRAFLVMELLSGMTLRQHLRQQSRLTSEPMLAIVRGVCSALSVAHERGLIHRDLKPENIFLIEDGRRTVPKILDFGLAKFVNASDISIQATTLDTGAGVLVGTPRYMSPEQLTGKRVSRSWDLWALAVIIYEMLSGACPFGNPEMVAALHVAILSGHCAPIQTHVPQAPARWQEFFTRSLAVEVARRSASALEFLSECEKAFA